MGSDEDRLPNTGSATSRGFNAPASVTLLPVSVVVFGSGDEPIERLMAMQSAIARGVDLVTRAGRIRLTLSAHGWPRLQLR